MDKLQGLFDKLILPGDDNSHDLSYNGLMLTRKEIDTIKPKLSYVIRPLQEGISPSDILHVLALSDDGSYNIFNKIWTWAGIH